MVLKPLLSLVGKVNLALLCLGLNEIAHAVLAVGQSIDRTVIVMQVIAQPVLDYLEEAVVEKLKLVDQGLLESVENESIDLPRIFDLWLPLPLNQVCGVF